MSLQIDELKKIFEYEIKRKLSERARSAADEYRNLINGFKFYDYTYSGKVNQTEFVKGILRTGLSGFNESDIRSIFNCYDINNTGYLDYKNFCNYLYGREPLNPLPPTSQNETQNTSNIADNNNINNKEQIVPKTKTPINIKQKTPLNNPNININNNPNLAENQNNQNLSQNQPEQIQQNIDPNQTKEYFKKLIISLKEQIHTFNGLTYYTLLFELKNNSDQNQNVSLENFVNLCKNLGINLPQNDIINFFNLLDFSGTGKISIEDIINNILDPISEHRKLYVVNKFAKLDVEKQGEVKVSLLKEKYNPKGHPDIISGKVTDEEIFKQFCYTLDIYCNLRNINENINYKQFIDYYNGISNSILDDKYFEDILNGVWDNEEIINDINPNMNMNMNNNNLGQNINQNIPQEQNQNNNNINQIQENRNMTNNFNNPVEQNNNNRRYNNEQNNKFDKQKFIDAGFCDENLGLNSIFLGESTHNIPSNFRRKHFKKYESPNDFNNYDVNKLNNYNSRNKNIKSNDFSQNNYNRNNYNKNPINQSQSIPNNQQNKNMNTNQYQENNNFNNFMNNNESRQKRFKISYNPITNEYIQRNPNNINSNQNNNRKTPLNQINNSNNESTASTITNNTNANINREEQAKDITINSLNKLKSTLIMRGIHSIFSFQRKLSLYDLNHQGLISFENFSNITQAYTMGISNDELKIIFDLFDKEKTGLINYNDLIQTIIGQISPQRKIIIKNVFDKFNKDNNGKVSINEIKLLFNPRRHPDTISGKKREGEVFGEFLDDIENYKEYLENSRGVYDNTFSLEDFINFYNEIGVWIDDDTIFEYMMNNCWNLDNNNNMGGSRYKNNTAHDFRSNNTNSGNLMARAGSQIINNNIF